MFKSLFLFHQNRSGSTEDVADSIVEQFGDDAEPAVNIDDVVGKVGAQCFIYTLDTHALLDRWRLWGVRQSRTQAQELHRHILFCSSKGPCSALFECVAIAGRDLFGGGLPGGGHPDLQHRRRLPKAGTL